MKRILMGGLGLVILILSAGSLPAAELPDWVRNTNDLYPSDRYITGVGQATTMVEAKKKAKAEVSKVLSQKVEATETMKQTTRETMTDNGNKFMQKMVKQTNIKIETAGELVGVEIKETESVFQQGRQSYYALAVMDKNQAASIYQRKFNNQRDKMIASYDRAQNAESTVGKLRALSQAHRYATAAEQYKNQLGVLLSLGASEGGQSEQRAKTSRENFRERMNQNLEGDQESKGDGSGPMSLSPSPEQIQKELSDMMESLSVSVNKLQFGNICKGSGFNGQLQGTIREAFTDLGFRTSSDTSSAVVAVDGSLSANYTTKGRRTDEAIRWDLTLNLNNSQTGKTFGTINEARVTVGRDKDHVASQTRYRITEWVKSNLGTLIVEKLLST